MQCTDKAEKSVPSCSSSQTGVCFTITWRAGSTRLLGPSPRGSDSIALGWCWPSALSSVAGTTLGETGFWRVGPPGQSPPPLEQLIPLSLVPLPLQTSLNILKNVSLYQPLERPFPFSSCTAISKSCIFPRPRAATSNHQGRWSLTSFMICSSPFVLNFLVIIGMILQITGQETLHWNGKTDCFSCTLQFQHPCCQKANALTYVFSHSLVFTSGWARRSCSSPPHSIRSQDLEMHCICYDSSQATPVNLTKMGSSDLAKVLF